MVWSKGFVINTIKFKGNASMRNEMACFVIGNWWCAIYMSLLLNGNNILAENNRLGIKWALMISILKYLSFFDVWAERKR